MNCPHSGDPNCPVCPACSPCPGTPSQTDWHSWSPYLWPPPPPLPPPSGASLLHSSHPKHISCRPLLSHCLLRLKLQHQNPPAVTQKPPWEVFPWNEQRRMCGAWNAQAALATGIWTLMEAGPTGGPVSTSPHPSGLSFLILPCRVSLPAASPRCSRAQRRVLGHRSHLCTQFPPRLWPLCTHAYSLRPQGCPVHLLSSSAISLSLSLLTSKEWGPDFPRAAGSLSSSCSCLSNDLGLAWAWPPSLCNYHAR